MHNNLDALYKFLSRDHYIHRILKLCGILVYRRRFSTTSISLRRMLILLSIFDIPDKFLLGVGDFVLIQLMLA